MSLLSQLQVSPDWGKGLWLTVTSALLQDSENKGDIAPLTFPLNLWLHFQSIWAFTGKSYTIHYSSLLIHSCIISSCISNDVEMKNQITLALTRSITTILYILNAQKQLCQYGELVWIIYSASAWSGATGDTVEFNHTNGQAKKFWS